jgi:hypothetical protein
MNAPFRPAVEAESPAWKLRRAARLAELKAGLERDDHPLESMVTIWRIEAAEQRERELAILWAGGER